MLILSSAVNIILLLILILLFNHSEWINILLITGIFIPVRAIKYVASNYITALIITAFVLKLIRIQIVFICAALLFEIITNGRPNHGRWAVIIIIFMGLLLDGGDILAHEVSWISWLIIIRKWIRIIYIWIKSIIIVMDVVIIASATIIITITKIRWLNGWNRTMNVFIRILTYSVIHFINITIHFTIFITIQIIVTVLDWITI